MTIALVTLYAFLILSKAVLVVRYRSPPAGGARVTIVQPILSGDPRLERTLGANVEAHPQAEFLWMIDADDWEAGRIGAKFARENLKVVYCPPPRNGENPKLAKLIQALAFVETSRLLVLDDDTCLAGELPAGPLVTGLPVFTATQTVYERLIGGFVNGSALLTYLPASVLKLQRSINGMLYAVETAQLRELGGFAAVGHDLTDDYAVARLYARHGIGAIQSTTPALVSMTVSSASHYIRVMRRWMIFASRYFGDNATLSTVFWIALPGLLPLAGFIFNPIIWTVTLLIKALLNRLLLWRIAKKSSTLVDLLFECLADLLTPVWILLSMIQPGKLTWRTRRIELQAGVIHYK